MKSAISIFSFILILFFTGPVFAQEHADHHPERDNDKQAEKRTGMMGKDGRCGLMTSGKETKHKMHGDMSEMDHRQMMQDTMMGSHDEAHQFMHTVQHLPFLGERLELTESQVEQLKETRNEFRTHKANLEAATKKNRIDLERMIDEKASASRVRAAMIAVSDIRVELKISAYETANKMLDLLTPEQKQQYAAMSMHERCPMYMGDMHGRM